MEGSNPSMKFFVILFLLPSLLYGEHDFCVLSIPKCGTHMLVKLMMQMTEKKGFGVSDLSAIKDANIFDKAKENGEFIFTHKMSPEQYAELFFKSHKILFIYRDPRDCLISCAFWVNKVPDYPPSKITNLSLLIHELITGDIYGMPIYEHIYKANFNVVKNLPASQVLMIKFEDLVGSKGGGDDDMQLLTILNIANFLEISLPLDSALKIAKNLWGESGTFRKGTIGQWKEHFSSEHLALFKDRYGRTLLEMNYEKDANW